MNTLTVIEKSYKLIFLNASFHHTHDSQKPHRETDTFPELQLPMSMKKHG